MNPENWPFLHKKVSKAKITMVPISNFWHHRKKMLSVCLRFIFSQNETCRNYCSIFPLKNSTIFRAFHFNKYTYIINHIHIYGLPWISSSDRQCSQRRVPAVPAPNRKLLYIILRLGVLDMPVFILFLYWK